MLTLVLLFECKDPGGDDISSCSSHWVLKGNDLIMSFPHPSPPTNRRKGRPQEGIREGWEGKGPRAREKWPGVRSRRQRENKIVSVWRPDNFIHRAEKQPRDLGAYGKWGGFIHCCCKFKISMTLLENNTDHPSTLHFHFWASGLRK